MAVLCHCRLKSGSRAGDYFGDIIVGAKRWTCMTSTDHFQQKILSMARAIWHLAEVIFWVSLVLSSSCQGPANQGNSGDNSPPPLTKTQLLNINLAYANYCSGKQRPPANLNELIPWFGETWPESYQRATEEVIRQLKAGKYVVVWNQHGADRAKKGTRIITAYEKGTPQHGGFAVFADGRIQWLSPSELQHTLPTASKDKSHNKPAAMPSRSKVFTSPDRTFRIRFPGIPNIEKTPPDPTIGKVEGRLYVLEKADRSYGVMYTRFSVKRTDAPKELKAGRDNMVRALNGKLIKDQNVLFQGHPGKDIVIDLGNGMVQRNRFFLTEFEMYQILIEVPRGEERSDAVEAFISSFHLLKK